MEVKEKGKNVVLSGVWMLAFTHLFLARFGLVSDFPPAEGSHPLPPFLCFKESWSHDSLPNTHALRSRSRSRNAETGGPAWHATRPPETKHRQ